MIVDDPENTDRLTEVYVFLSIDEAGNNGIVAGTLPGFGALPLCTGSPNVAEAMKRVALGLAQGTPKRIGLYRFVREELLWESSQGAGGNG